MTLIRAFGRTLLASYFIASGVKAARKPSLYVEQAQPVTDKLVPALKKYAPAQVAGYIPEDTETLVRINGGLQIVGGLALATGKGRRLGAWLCAYSMVPATVARHPFWTESDPEVKAAERSHFLKNVALLGGVILAARDTEGQPGLRWRTAAGAHALNRSGQRAQKAIARTGHTVGDSLAKTGHSVGDSLAKTGHSVGDSLAKTGHSLGGSLSEGAEAAVAGGIALAGVVAEQSRKARKEAEKQTKKAGKLARKNAPKLRKQAEKASKLAAARAAEAQKVAGKQAKILAKKAKPLQKEAAKQAAAVQKAAAKQARNVAADVKDRAAEVRKGAEKVADSVGQHIELGNN